MPLSWRGGVTGSIELLPASSIDLGMIERVDRILFRLLMESLVCLLPELNAPGGVLMCCIQMMSQHSHVDSHQSFLHCIPYLKQEVCVPILEAQCYHPVISTYVCQGVGVAHL